MDNLIPLVNKLQDVFGAIGQQPIDLPQITVVGAQSAGKSSVLEHIVGRDFLPRGTGIVTRRPLVLQLYNTGAVTDIQAKSGNINKLQQCTTTPPYPGTNQSRQPDSAQSNVSMESTSFTSNTPITGEEWGEFLHIPNQRFYDFNDIRTEIIRETDRITGKNKGISNKTINLKIFSPHVLNLTLVDLPGITKVPTGDQPEDVEELIRTMCIEFISNPNAIILAVTPANQDIANSDGLKLARSVDPEGKRTIGVLTKVDIMDQGTDCTEILLNHVIPLRRGYIGVINRSQKDIMDNVSIRQCLVKEQAYFQTHPKYRTISSKCGTLNLTRTLNQLLVHHIRDCLPEIRSKIVAMMNEVNNNIDSLGEAVDTLSNNELGKTLLRLISHFSNKLTNIVDGHDIYANTSSNGGDMSGVHSPLPGSMGGGNGGAFESGELFGGARIAYIFNEMFVNHTIKQMNPFEGLTDVDIRTAIANANGAKGPSLFVPEAAFELLVRKQIERLREPGLQCIDVVYDEIQRIAQLADSTDVSRFPTLRDRMFDVVNRLLRSCVTPAQAMITNLIDVELSYINTSHPDFIGGKNAVQQMNRKLNPPPNANQGNVHGGGNAQGTRNAGGNAMSSGEVVIGSKHPSSGQTQGPNQGQAYVNASENNGGSVNSQSQPVPQSNSNSNGSDTALNGNTRGDVVPSGGFFGLFKPLGVGGVSGNASGTNTLPNPPSSGDSITSQNQFGYSTNTVVKLPSLPDHLRSSHAPSDREKLETGLIKTLVASYFDIVRKNYMDLVPKSIMHFLVHCFKDKLQNELVSQLYRDTAYMQDLLKESEDVASRRKAYKEMKDLLTRALGILNEVRDFNTFK